MKNQRLLLIPLAVIIIAILAYFLRTIVNDWIILPFARFVWLVKGYYGAFPQEAYWGVALLGAIIMATLALRLPNWIIRQKMSQDKSTSSPVREMSFWIQRTRGGSYPKWHMAHLLAELAQNILDLPGTSQKNSLSEQNPDWYPPPGVKEYLEAGLYTTPANYPLRKGLGASEHTPLDQELEPVVEYLESLLESENDHHK